MGSSGGGASGDGNGSGAGAGKSGGIPRTAGKTAGQSTRSDAADDSQSATGTAPRGVPEGDNEKILRAAHILVEEKIARPIPLWNAGTIRAKWVDLDVEVDEFEIEDTATWAKREEYVAAYYKLRQRRGMTLSEARDVVQKNRNIFGTLMVELGDADALGGDVAFSGNHLAGAAGARAAPRCGSRRNCK